MMIGLAAARIGGPQGTRPLVDLGGPARERLWPSATPVITNNTINTNNTNERTNKQTSRKFPVGFDPTKVIDIQSARASYGIRAHDLPFTEQVLCQLSYRGFSCVF